MKMQKADREDVLEPILQSIIENYQLKNATRKKKTSDHKKGDGFVGYPHNVQLNHEDGKLNLIVKIAPENEKYRKQLYVREMYLNEINFYETVVPYFEDFQAAKRIRNPLDLFPKYYGSHAEQSMEMLALENLKDLGYALPNPKQVSEEELVVILKEYGRFHGVSLIAKSEDPEGYEKLCRSMYKDMEMFNADSRLTQSIVAQCERVERVIAAKMGNDSETLSRLEKFRKGNMQLIMNRYEYCHDKHSIIIHGDAKTHNILIKYEDSKPIRAKLIDFQVSRVGSLAQDLSYLIYTCCENTRYSQIENYLKIYYESLREQANTLGRNIEDIFTYQELKEQWKKYSIFGLCMTIVVLHSMNAEPHEFPDLNEVIENGDYIFLSLGFQSINENIYEEKIVDVIEHFVEENLI